MVVFRYWSMLPSIVGMMPSYGHLKPELLLFSSVFDLFDLRSAMLFVTIPPFSGNSTEIATPLAFERRLSLFLAAGAGGRSLAYIVEYSA